MPLGSLETPLNMIHTTICISTRQPEAGRRSRRGGPAIGMALHIMGIRKVGAMRRTPERRRQGISFPALNERLFDHDRGYGWGAARDKGCRLRNDGGVPERALGK